MAQKFEALWENRIVRTVSRGPVCCRVQEKWAEIRKFADEQDIQELTKFVCNLKDCDNFGGVLHRNIFRVSRRVGLVGLGFFGPHHDEVASFDVTITVEHQPRKRVRTLFSTEFYNVRATRWGMFYVTFHNMIVLDPDRFYTIAFQLDGPNTGILDPVKVVQTVVDERPSIEFTFLRGSLQMPEIKYVIL